SVVNSPPTVATPASASPNPVTAKTTNLSVLGADDGGEANLTYTWATTGTPPAPVTFSASGTNAAKNVVATFAKAGGYSFQGTISAAGLFTAGTAAGGPFTVTASSGGVNGTASVTVTAPPLVNYVQGAATSDDSIGSSMAQAFTAPTVSGNLIVAAVSWGTNS